MNKLTKIILSILVIVIGGAISTIVKENTGKNSIIVIMVMGGLLTLIWKKRKLL